MSTPFSSSGLRRIAVLCLVLALLMVTVSLIYIGRLSRSDDARRALAEENAQLKEDVAQLRKDMEAMRRMPWQRSAASEGAADVAEKQEPEPVESVAPPNTVVLDTTSVTPADSGLVARMTFQPTTGEPLDIFALVVRLPRDSTARIVGLQPTGDAAYTNTRHRVAENGLFAIYEGNPIGLTPLQFDLSVTEPVTATVRGTRGLDAFEMDIQPDVATVTKR